MKNMIIVNFFKSIPDLFGTDLVWGVVMLAVLIAAAVTQLILLKKQQPGYVLPGSILLGLICCELFGKTLEGGERMLTLLGGIFIMGLLGTVVGNLISMAGRKNQK